MNEITLCALFFVAGFTAAMTIFGLTQHQHSEEIRRTLDSLRSQHLDDRLLHLLGLVSRWRQMARNEDDAAVSAARKLCAEDLEQALKTRDRCKEAP